MELRNRTIGEDTEDKPEEEEALIEPSVEVRRVSQAPEKSGIAGDEKSILILLFLYILQGIPLGLAAAIPLILTNRNVSYKQQAEFSFAYWPFSIKLLWAPIVDSIFIGKFGRRKTWLVPVQYLIGATMFVLSKNVDFYLEVNVVTFIFPLSTAKHSFVITYAIQSPVTSKNGHQNFSRRLVISDGNN